MLLMKNVSISYKTKKEIYLVIQNLSLKIGQGEALAIIGPSGCGKSTLVNALAGSISMVSGNIDYIKDNDRQTLNSKTHKIGIIPQSCGLLPWKTVRENCILPLKIRKEQIEEQRKQEIIKIYETLDIAKLLERYPKELSGGQVQRVAIARAFILRPDLLLMDEPFSSLDEITREEARELFLKIWEQNRPTTILVTHSIEEALYLGNRIIVMGAHVGDIIYQMQNSYFGKLYPDSVEYLLAKRLLREKLKPNDKREELCE
ncbi:MAG: ABC transporter ATP-binding protein [Ruminiclostridium sp.]